MRHGACEPLLSNRALIVVAIVGVNVQRAGLPPHTTDVHIENCWSSWIGVACAVSCVPVRRAARTHVVLGVNLEKADIGVCLKDRSIMIRF